MNPSPLRCAISDRNAGTKSDQANLIGQAAQLAAEGVEMLQLREKDLGAGELASLARALLLTLGGSRTALLINGRADVAVAVRAPGVHLTSHSEELTPGQVHQLYAGAGLAPPVITLSCHSIDDVMRVRVEPVTAILFGPVFEKSVAGEHLRDGIGLSLLRQACELAAPVPVLALGGITEANLAQCVEAGVAGFAGIRLFQRS